MKKLLLLMISIYSLIIFGFVTMLNAGEVKKIQNDVSASQQMVYSVDSSINELPPLYKIAGGISKEKLISIGELVYGVRWTPLVGQLDS